jgi:phosphoribosylaminoimidazolecarboxamide formyltransferase / IMP cyclohydrolase
MSDRVIRRALLSVSDKSGLIEFAHGLSEYGVTLISTGGTRKELSAAGLKVIDVSDVTGFPEMLDGRVKTLHPRIHGGILAVRDDPKHTATLAEHKIEPIDLVVVNLYPFEQTVARQGSTRDEIIENIDIGGPSLIRAAAKNHDGVAVITGPDQYAAVLEEMKTKRSALSMETRARLAAAAFARTAAYDRAIADYFAGPAEFPDHVNLSFKKKFGLRYGENPHQQAAFYADPRSTGASVAAADVLNGKELSYNNLLDLDSALNLVREFRTPAACVIKHNNPCGAALGESLAEAFQKAYEGDPVSAFGGILAFNRELDEATATLITEPNRFVEAIIAPAYSDSALKLLTTRPKWGKNVRILSTGPIAGPASGLDFRRVDGGLLVQSRDASGDDFAAAKVVTKRHPADDERADLAFAWLVGKHVKSNAIVLAKNRAIIGVGAGQMSRIDSTEIAIKKAGERCRSSVLASDAFFPFRDNIDAAAKAGVVAIAEPGGSVRDAEAIAACDEHDIAMLFTGVRHFRH